MDEKYFVTLTMVFNKSKFSFGEILKTFQREH
jgi:hypothetical protein